MASKAKCRVCGKEYKPCRNTKYAPSVFNWREVSCSPECGEIYLAQIIASRTPVEKKSTKKAKVSEDIDAE